MYHNGLHGRFKYIFEFLCDTRARIWRGIYNFVVGDEPDLFSPPVIVSAILPTNPLEIQYIMAQFQLRGMGVALVTPFKADKSIDYDALETLVDYQIKEGADFLTVLGTTAEAVTLTPKERREVASFVVEKTAGRVPLIVGCGGNNTAELVERLHNADLSPFSAVLSVVPYYNKPSQEGIFRHYAAIAEASPLPVVLYNVPGRTGVNMSAETSLRLAEAYPHIIGVKEASGNIAQVDEIIKHKPEGFNVISGDDGTTYALIALGAEGVISVIGNAFPNAFSRMVHFALKGEDFKARTIHHRFADLYRLLSVDGNPSGIKCVLNKLGLIANELRLPLVPVSESTAAKIDAQLTMLTDPANYED